MAGGHAWSGAYDDEATAARAYDLAAIKYWGNDATLNFPVLRRTISFPAPPAVFVSSKLN